MDQLCLENTQMQDFEDKFIPEPNSGCWLWLFGSFSSGYGCLRVGSTVWYAHRLSWTLYKGPIPVGVCVLHKCDTRLCVNPQHLFLGSKGDNNADRASKDRSATGERHGRSVLTTEDVAYIRTQFGKKSLRAIAREMGVSKIPIQQIYHGLTWKGN